MEQEVEIGALELQIKWEAKSIAEELDRVVHRTAELSEEMQRIIDREDPLYTKVERVAYELTWMTANLQLQQLAVRAGNLRVLETKLEMLKTPVVVSEV